jgi:hypothetical protein
MDEHYKNRCGKGKAAANGFLMNLLNGHFRKALGEPPKSNKSF